ncbi:Solanesyl-diphosphate synthase 1, mitochondrial [Dichanthelium oligosanthes]|uniref:Solanesyl-diphosphate synthase 1, mitochondrial n=1 Tax=Dichanthelium oligosanthes TaxID=888268 RepID=A0A1E5UYK7_9POAL|nr:Solanesyl-diphosphate synthase 1, mitochondrial [Dichanthelium oligosanthes]
MSWRWALARRVAALAAGSSGAGGVAQAQRLLTTSSGAGAALLGRQHLPLASQIQSKVVGCRGAAFVSSRWVHDAQYQVRQDGDSRSQEHRDPFELVADDLSLVADRLRSMVAAEVPKLASAAEYFFKVGAEGKKFRPTVLLLMASALKFPLSESRQGGVLSILADKLRTPHLNIAEITEMIHVASLLHDDVLDDADTRRGVSSLNLVMGNKLSVLAGDFLLSRACVALAALGNTEVVSLMATAVEHLVTGETMQISTSREQRRSSGMVFQNICSMDYYLQKTYYKTASLISNSCKAVAILAGHTAEVSMLALTNSGSMQGLAFQLIDDVLDFTGTSASLGKGSLSDIRHNRVEIIIVTLDKKDMGIITAPILYAMEEFPQLNEVVDQGFDNPANVELALDYLQKSRGIERTKELAQEHANRAIKAIEALPDSDDEDVLTSRRALIDITERVITRTK